jgi:protein ImuB
MKPAPSLPPRPSGRRYLSLALPYLATDRIHRLKLGRSWRSAALPDTPLAIVAKIKSALRLAALDETAGQRGLRIGQALADARAMIPTLEAIDEDAAAVNSLLEGLADWAERYTPLVALDPPSGLTLDITGAAHLFGGEEALLTDLTKRLGDQGFLARAAIADTPGAASAAARFGALSVIPVGSAATILEALPLAALRLDHETVSAMDRVGLKRIGQIIAAPRAPLAARFGATLIRRLDQALGLEEEAINPRRPIPALIAERRFAEPIIREEDIAATLSSLAATLAQNLEARGEGARVLEFALFRVDGIVARVAIGTSRPIRAPRLILDLFREKFASLGDTLDAGFGFDTLRLAIGATAPCDPTQIDLTGETAGEVDLGQLIDRIGVRLGSDRVGRIAAHASHIPERAATFELPQEKGFTKRDDFPSLSVTIDRPLRLLSRPEPVEAVAEVPDGPPVHFRWRKALYCIARAEGPERIATEWWRNDDDLTRDYFRVEDISGHRFWLFREGLYGRETVEPRWYLHGMFA